LARDELKGRAALADPWRAWGDDGDAWGCLGFRFGISLGLSKFGRRVEEERVLYDAPRFTQ